MDATACVPTWNLLRGCSVTANIPANLFHESCIRKEAFDWNCLLQKPRSLKVQGFFFLESMCRAKLKYNLKGSLWNLLIFDPILTSPFWALEFLLWCFKHRPCFSNAQYWQFISCECDLSRRYILWYECELQFPVIHLLQLKFWKYESKETLAKVCYEFFESTWDLSQKHWSNLDTWKMLSNVTISRSNGQCWCEPEMTKLWANSGVIWHLSNPSMPAAPPVGTSPVRPCPTQGVGRSHDRAEEH